MRKVAVRALQKPNGGFFIAIYQHELDVLRTLPPWMRGLFEELIACCNFGTGAGQTTYTALVANLTPIQPRSGPRFFAPDWQAIRRALVRFEFGGIVERKTDASQLGEFLFFEIEPRPAKVRPQPKLEWGSRTPPTSRENKRGRGLQQNYPPN